MGRNTTMLMSMADQKTQAPKAKQTGMFTGNTLTSPWHYFSDHPCSSSLSYSSPFSSALCNWGVALEMEIKAMPTFLMMKGGGSTDKLVGANPDAIKKMLKS
ncbi:hypothetical protein GBA52_014229 [Prunus armeniaca]|nr:hypothetical protein GBA52_014229 [Prunus armeniaca]